MEIKTLTPRGPRGIINADIKQYPHDLNIYSWQPKGMITLDDMQKVTFNRLKLHRIIENASNKIPEKYSKQWEDLIIKDAKEAGLQDFLKLIFSPSYGMSEADILKRKHDHVSFSTLLCGHAHSAHKRNWLTERELELFKMRFKHLKPDSHKKFMEIIDLKSKYIPDEEKRALRQDLLDSTDGILSEEQFEVTNFYKTHFINIPDLLADHAVLIKKAYAYIPAFKFESIIAEFYRKTTLKGLFAILRNIPFEEYDKRFQPILQSLETARANVTFASMKDQISVPMLDFLSKESFPLCMRRSHEIMQGRNHIKYTARRQYQLFLKGIGLDMDSCIEFFRNVFCKKMDVDSFEKGYVYNIKHNYGKAGNMTDYSPFACRTIISLETKANEAHGCAFKVESSEKLKLNLLKYGLADDVVQNIIDYSSKGHYQIACGKYFEALYKKPISVVHPNQYYEETKKVLMEKKKQEAELQSQQTQNSTVVKPSTSNAKLTTTFSQASQNNLSKQTNSMNKSENKNVCDPKASAAPMNTFEDWDEEMLECGF